MKEWIKKILTILFMVLFLFCFVNTDKFIQINTWKPICEKAGYNLISYDGRNIYCINTTTKQYIPAKIIEELNK